MSGATTFDVPEGRRLRDIGMLTAAQNRALDLGKARSIARGIAEANNGFCDINQVQKQMVAQGVNLGNAAGSVFKGKEWERVGFGQAERDTSHARVISKWRLKSFTNRDLSIPS